MCRICLMYFNNKPQHYFDHQRWQKIYASPFPNLPNPKGPSKKEQEMIRMNATITEAPPPQSLESIYYMGPLILISFAGMIFSALVIAAFTMYNCILLCFVDAEDGNSDTNGDSFKGVHVEILKKIPILSYSTQKVEVFRLDHSECAICLGELEDGELVRLLPSCKHAFHIPCVDTWFMEHSNCPFCRLPVVPLVSETLASENDRCEETVLNVMPNLQGDADLSSCNSKSQPESDDLHERHSFSIASRMGKKPSQEMGLKRSLSMGQSCIAISIQDGGQEKASTSGSSSAKGFVKSSKDECLRQIDHVNSILMRSFSQVRNSRCRCSNGILPN